MTCKFCGNEMDEHADFCPTCGQAQQPETAKPDETPAPEAREYQLVEDDIEATTAAEDDSADDAADADAPKEKKPKKEKTKANFFVRLISCLFIVIGLIIYAIMKKRSTIEKAYSVANAVLVGVCIRLAAVIIYFMMSYGWITLDALMPIISKLSGQA